MRAVDCRAEIAVLVALALPADVSTEVAGRLAAGLRLLVAALPPSVDNPGDRAMSRDLLVAAEMLESDW